MRVLFVCTDFPPTTGGIQTMMGSLARELTDGRSAARWDLMVLAPRAPQAELFDQGQPYRIVRAPRLGSGPGARRALPGMAAWTLALATRERPDALLCAHPVDGLMGPLLRAGLGVPTVVMTHSRELRSPRLRPLLPWLFARTARVVTNSHHTTREVCSLGTPKAKVARIPLGYDPRRFAGVTPSHLPETLGLTGRRWLLTVTRLQDWYKGVDTVIRAMPQILEQVPDCHYVVAGDGRLRPQLEQLATELGVGARVLFPGRVSDADLFSLYAHCTAFVLMSRDSARDGGCEGFGLVLLEANSFGKPVLGGNSGGIPDAVVEGQTGLLADPENVTDVARQAIRLLTDGEFATRLGRQGRDWVLHERTWSACAAALSGIVEEAARTS